jgi:peptidyl-tRNA hydrolase
VNAEKLYVVVRGDLVPGSQAVQAMHAARQFAEEHREREARWFAESNHIAFLSVSGERELFALRDEARLRGILSSKFEEPDLGGQSTAIVLPPEARRICSRLGLALRL